MQYLAVAYGPDKGDDPASAELLLEQLIQRDRSNAYNHRALGRLYHRAREFENAIAAFREVTALEPDNAEGFYTLATYYWEKAFRDTSLSDEQRLETVMLGITEVNKALALKTDYMQALVYKHIPDADAGEPHGGQRTAGPADRRGRPAAGPGPGARERRPLVPSCSVVGHLIFSFIDNTMSG